MTIRRLHWGVLLLNFQEMDLHESGLVSAWLLRWAIMGLVAFSLAIADDPSSEPPPATNPLCISECGTCPVICSSPPPPPPPFKFYSPPTAYVPHHSRPPPPPPPPRVPPPNSGSTPPSPYYILNAPPGPPPPPGSHSYSRPYYYFYGSGAPASVVGFLPSLFTVIFFICEGVLVFGEF